MGASRLDRNQYVTGTSIIEIKMQSQLSKSKI